VARGGEALVSSLVNELVATTGEFTFEKPREIELKRSKAHSASIR